MRFDRAKIEIHGRSNSMKAKLQSISTLQDKILTE